MYIKYSAVFKLCSIQIFIHHNAYIYPISKIVVCTIYKKEFSAKDKLQKGKILNPKKKTKKEKEIKQNKGKIQKKKKKLDRNDASR